ncbi:o-succinylbenzoate synthase [Bacillus sp. 2205SS5-2]|uniref:o-succinylbenzoate synthase n=1 Tax=Bacillus sp. 2205SS5-2 TaxID=3109031 RepID=UPI0030061F32
MKLNCIRLHVIEMNLKTPFETALEVVSNRKGIIVEVIDEDGLVGYGECVAFSTPWYTEETISTCYHMITKSLIPLLQQYSWSHPGEVRSIFASVRRNRMAKAALETAIWDLFAKQQNQPLWKIIGGENKPIPAGVVIGTSSVDMAITQIEEYIHEGYTRIKVKIAPGRDYNVLKKIREKFPKLDIMADANSSYTLADIKSLQKLDELELLMIEQPLDVEDLVDHAKLQQYLQTPICLDESIGTIKDVQDAHNLDSCSVINLKIGRVGGLSEAIAIHDFCLQHQLGVWCGGMLEFGVSRAHNLALSSLPGFIIPGDISSSSRYWEEDIVLPEVVVKNGYVNLMNQPGIGIKLNQKRMGEVTTHKEEIYFSS